MYQIFEDPKQTALEKLVDLLFETKREFIVEDSAIIRHLEHLEDLTITSKDRFINTIRQLLKLAHQHEGSDDTMVVEKIDGAPALFFLNDPRNNKFGVSTKSIGGKTQKIAHSNKEIQKLFESEGLQNKLSAALLHLSELNLGGYAFQGDVLFTKEDIHKQRVKGKDYLTFTPNVLMYAVAIDSASELYQKIATSDFGIVVHTVYKVEDIGGSLSLTPMRNFGAIYDLVEQGSKTEGMFITHPYHPQIKLEVSEKDIANIEKILARLEKTNYKYPTVKAKDYFNQFINHEIKSGTVATTAEGMLKNFISFLDTKKAEEVNKRKTDKGKATVEGNFQKIYDEIKMPTFMNFLRVYVDAMEVKRIFLGVFSKVGSKLGTTFFKKGEGFETTGTEGFILAADEGIVKLVDRNVFSKTNFLMGAFNKPKE